LAKLRALPKYPFGKYLKQHKRAYTLGFISLVIVDAINVLLPLTVKEAVDAIGPKDFNRVLWMGAIYVALMLGQAVGRYLWRLYLMGSSHEIARELRLRLYDHLQRLPLSYYQRVRTGDLMSRATNDIESIRMAVGPGILVSVDAILVFVFIVPVMFWLSPKLTLLTFAFFPFVPWITAKLGDKIDTLFESLQKKMSGISAHAQESFGAVRLIKSLVLEPRMHERFRGLSEDYRAEGMELAKYQAVFSPLLTLITNLGTLLILVVGGLDVMSGTLTLGTFIAFQRFVVQLSWPMEAIGWAVTMNREGIAADRRLDEMMQVAPVSSTTAIEETSDFGSRLYIRELVYAHADSNDFGLEIRDLSIEPGQKIGLVGGVGSGKSTLFNLLLRLYEPPARSIYLDGTDICAIPLEKLRQKVASVEQQIFLFSEKVLVNMTLGNPRDVSEEEVVRASEVACIRTEVGELNDGFGTRLGERGINLSGGQKQRLALTRALVRQPSLLLLDDCFSAVDVEIESRIIENFFELYPELSVCFASHRLSVMPRMDEIWLLERGKLVGRGTHRELLKSHPLYQSLWEKSERRLEEETADLGIIVEEVAK